MTLRNIPSAEKLWRSVHSPHHLKPDGSIKSGFFKNKDGLSCDLARLSTMERSRRGHGEPPPWPDEAGLVEFSVGAVRNAGSGVDVVHVPLRPPEDPFNYAHSQVSRGLTTGEANALIASVGSKPYAIEPRLRK